MIQSEATPHLEEEGIQKSTQNPFLRQPHFLLRKNKDRQMCKGLHMKVTLERPYFYEDKRQQ